MEDLVIGSADRPHLNVAGRKVLVTGHTGFKGAWLVEWLLSQGAVVSGLALPPEPEQPLFAALGHERRMEHILCDVRDREAVGHAVRRTEPELVFHLAAQALVLRSYREPLRTWETNVLGTLNLLEALRALEHPVTAVVVTTDKVYRNREWEFAYREDDELGGMDPYSASKAACEVAVASWRASFGDRAGVTVVTARAGNVLGAGDYNADRIVPDCFRAWRNGETVQLRHPSATRPWQHVLEPLSGYLALAASAASGSANVTACNFGPGPSGVQSVETLVRALAGDHPRRRWTRAEGTHAHEAHALSLSIERARLQLGWFPVLSFAETVSWTEEGYGVAADHLPSLIARQISQFESRRGLSTPAVLVQ